MPTKINADTVVGGAVVTADASGILELQSAGTTALTLSGANVSTAGNLAVTGNVSVTGTLNSTTGLSSPALIAGAASGAQIRLGEATANGTNYAAVKAPDNLAANYTLTLPSADGTSGQFLQTNGAGQLTFASPTSGTQQFTSSGSITAGQPVSINTDGTVSTTTGVEQAASFSAVSNLIPNPRVASYYDAATGWYLVAMAKIDANYDVYLYSYKVNADGTLAGGNGVYLGAPGSGYAADLLRITKDTVNNVYGIGVYGQYGYTSIMFAEMTNTTTGALTSRGQTYVSYNTPYRYWAMGLCFDVNSARFVMAYVTSSSTLAFAAINYANKTITATSSLDVMYNSSNATISIAANTTSNNMLVVYSDTSNYQTSRVVSLNTAGTTFTVGSPTTFGYTGASVATFMSYFPGVDRYVIQVGSSSGLYSYLLNASGSQISIATTAPADAGSFFNTFPVQSGPDFVNNRMYSLMAYSSVQTVFYYNITATAITYGGVSGTSSNSPALTGNSAIAFDGTNSRALLASYYTANGTGCVRGYLPPVSYTNADKFVGFAAQSVATGQPVTVTVLGGVNTSQTGLTTATAYYLQYNGSLVTAPTQYGIVARALSTTSVQVTTGGAAMKLISQTAITGNPASVTINLPSGYQQLQIVFQSLQARGSSSYITITGTNTGGSALGFYGHGLIGSGTNTPSAFATSGTLYPHGSASAVSDYGVFNGYLTMNAAYSTPAFTSMCNTSSTASGAVVSTITGYVSAYPASIKVAPNGTTGYWGGGAIYVYGIG